MSLVSGITDDTSTHLYREHAADSAFYFLIVLSQLQLDQINEMIKMLTGFETFNDGWKVIFSTEKGIGVIFSDKEPFHFQKILCRTVGAETFGDLL